MNFTLQGLVADYHTLRIQHTELVLATILATEGSTYRKAGARMLITPDACCYGLLGGNELHQAILARVAPIFATRELQILDFDSQSIDSGNLAVELEPGARVTVLLQYLAVADPNNTLELLLTGLRQQQAVLVTICESALADCSPGANVLIAQAAAIHSDLDPRYSRELTEIASQIRDSGISSLESCMSGEGSFTAFYDIITPPLQLLIIGAGPDVIPVLRLATTMDWLVTIVDPRSANTQSEYFETAYRVLTLEPEGMLAAVDIDRIDAVVIMTHRLDLDQRYLQCLRGNTSLKYIGLLGTERRKHRLLQALALDPAITGERIYGPVGLDLGGRSPEQIALALVSEIQAVVNQCSGGRLTSQAAPALQAEPPPVVSEQDLYAIVLAAGGSTRFGGIKQLLELDGKSLLKRAIDTTSNTFDNRVKLVLGIKPNKLQREADGYDIEIVVNKDWENGIASSLRTGIKALPARCKGVLIILCDQPYINETHIRQMIDVWKRDHTKIIASSYANTVGVPAIFPAQHFPAIQQLRGDTGAKAIIESNLEQVIRVSIPEAEIDIDTQEDLIKILSK
ncbi:MAG: NTP transf 3 protein [Gammaproteobacteria bacterium]|nr:NTP transf 3 protein [Gammaproteobacteria bacterium]